VRPWSHQRRKVRPRLSGFRRRAGAERLHLEDISAQNLPPAHFAYLATGVEADGTIPANRRSSRSSRLRASDGGYIANRLVSDFVRHHLAYADVVR
jgi:hypothetical protein